MKGAWLYAWIFVTSLAFYALEGQPWFLVPMLLTVTLDYYLARYIMRANSNLRRRSALTISIVANLGLLMTFKYSSLFLGSLFGAPQSALHGVLEFIARLGLPAGISFYTFQTLSYMIDVYHGRVVAEKSFLKFGSFVAFFPHLVAGPLTRDHQLMPQHLSALGGWHLFVCGWLL